MVPIVLLADLDNTVYDWAAFFAPSFRAMVHALARELKKPEDQLYREFKAVFARHESLEFAFSIQELDSVRAEDKETISRLIALGRGAFNSVKRKRLQPYPGAKETLEWLREQQVIVVGVTNSPVWHAQKRLYDLHLDTLFSGLVGWEGFEASSEAEANSGYVPAGRIRKRTRIREIRAVPEEECKPNTRHYLIALDAFRASPENAWAIGDSLKKDLEPAARLGIRTIWARYGAGFDPEDDNMKTLLRITHWDAARIQTTYEEAPVSPDAVADSFEDLQRILPTRFRTLF